MERQSTSKLFRILIAIAAFFILCSSSLLFAACDSTIGVKDHEHVLGETAIAETEASCTVPGTVTYKCTDEECSYVKTVVTGLPTGHDFDENGVCRVCKLTKSEAGDLDDTLQSTQAIQKTLADITKTLEGVAKSAALSNLLTEEQFTNTLNAKITDLQTKLIADLLSDADFGTAMSTLKTTLQCDIVAQVYLPLLAKCPTEFAALKEELVGKELVKAEADDLTVLKAAITSDDDAVATKLNAVLTAAIEADGEALDAAFDALNESLPNTLQEKVVEVLETYLSGDDFLGKIMGETGFAGLQQQIKGYLGEGSDVVTQLDNIWKYLNETLKGQINGIVEKLGDAESGLVKSVADLATQLTDATSDIKDAIGELQIPTAADIADAVDTKLVGSLKTYFASSEYTDVIQGLLDNTFTTEKLNTLLGVTEESLVAELNKKFKSVTDKIDGLNTLLTEGTTGKQIADLEDMIKQVYSRMYGTEYTSSTQSMMDSLLGAPSTGKEEKPVGMLDQVDDLWDKTKGLLDGLTAMRGDESTTLKSILDAVNGIEFPEGEYTDSFANLKTTLEGLDTKYGELNGTLTKLQGDYDSLKASYETLSKDVGSMKTTLGEVQETLNGLVDDLQWVLTRSAKFEALMTVLENLWKEYGSYVLNEDLRSGLKTVLDFAVKNVDKLDKLGALTDTLAWFVNNKSKFESYVTSLDKYIEDIEKIYNAFHTALPDESLDTVLGKLQTFFQKALENNYFEEAINAAKGLKNFLGTTDESGTPTITLKDIDAFFDGISETLNAITNKGYDKNGNHVHSWVEVLAVQKGDSYEAAPKDAKPLCLAENIYIFKCTICDLTQTTTDGTLVTKKVPATGHVVEYKTGLTAEGHHHEPTCVNPGYVQGHCVNCDGDDGQGYLAGDWSTYGEPTYKHQYVLEDGTTAPDTDPDAAITAHDCTSVHEYVWHCLTCGGAYVEKVEIEELPLPSGSVHGTSTTPHNYYTLLDKDDKPTGDPLPQNEKDAYYAAAQKHPEKYKEIVTVEGLYKAWAEAHEGKTVETLTQQEKYDILKPYLNIVNHGNRTCIDPELAVVECTVCKMRYAYSYGEPLGHTLVLQTAADASATCTTDGVVPYYYCKTCGYYFYFDTDEINWQAKKSPVKTSDIIETDGKTADKYRFWNQYLSDDDGVIKGEPTGEKGALTEAGQRAYDWAAVKAYGHKFDNFTYSIAGDCGWADRTFKICVVCGEPEEEVDGAIDLGSYKVYADHYKLNKLTDDHYEVVGPYTFGKEVGYTWEPRKYTEKNDGEYWQGEPNFITNLKALVEGSKETEDLNLQPVADKLEELGYAAKGAIKVADYEDVDALLAAYITGWNVTPYTLGEIKTHSFVPVYVGRVDCITAQDYILVCKDCYTANGKSFNELFDEVKDGDDACHYTVKSTATDLLTEGKADATKILQYATLTYTADETHYESDLSLSWKALVGANTTTDAVLGWLEKYGFLVFDKEDDMNLEKFKALYAGKEWTEVEAELVKYYGEGKNVIDTGLELPVQGHSFKEGVITVVGNCVMYQRTVWYCEVCCDKSSQLNPEDPKTGPAPFNVTIKLDPLRQGTWQNDLVASWAAARNAEDATVDSVLLWLANHGYLNAEREFLGYEIYTEGVFQTVEAGSAELTALKKFIADVEFKVQPESLQLYQLDAFFTWGNTTREFTAGNHVHDEESAAGEYKSQNVIGHHFNAIWVDSASCEEGGYYVYVCTECGMEDEPTGKFSYTIDGTTYETEIFEATDFTLKADSDAELTDAPDDQSLFDDAVHADRRATFNGGKTDLALLVEAAIGDDDTTNNGTAVMTLAVLGYFDTIGDTMAGVGKAGYDKTVEYKVSEHWDDFVKNIAAVIADEDIPEVTKLSDFFTQTNQTLAEIGTIVPVMNHRMYTHEGELITDNTAMCTEFASKEFTEWLNPNDDEGDHFFAKWNAAEKKWEKGEKLSDADWTKLKENTEFYEAARKYGVIGACVRDNCPQHKPDYTGTNAYTAGYVAAQPHEMIYVKFAESTSYGPDKHIPSAKLENTTIQYNTKAVADYEVAEETVKSFNTQEKAEAYLVKGTTWATADDDAKLAAATLAAQTDAQLKDMYNLYTLQKLYNLLHLPKQADWDSRWGEYPELYPTDGELYTTYYKEGKLEIKNDADALVYDGSWMPLTRDGSASCWVDLRCKWYHYGNSADNPLPVGFDPKDATGKSLYDGTRCSSHGLKTAHTLPKDGDWNYSNKARNCQHGDMCYTCDKEMTKKSGHTLMEVTKLTGESRTAWKRLFKSQYQTIFVAAHSEYDYAFGLKEGSTYTDASGKENVIDGKEYTTFDTNLYTSAIEAELWDAIEATLFAPTCDAQGYKVYVCTGELYKYTQSGYKFEAADWVEEENGIDLDGVEGSGIYVPRTTPSTYYVEDVEPTRHKDYELRHFYLNDDVIDPEVWNDGFNNIICLDGYYTEEVCTHPQKYVKIGEEKGEECGATRNKKVYEAANHTLAPIVEYWKSDRYTSASDTVNATVEHVCVICGEHVVGVYGATDAVVGGSRVQYNIATKPQIDTWNNNGGKIDPKLDADGYTYVAAQEIRTEDISNSYSKTDSEVAAGGTIFSEGTSVYKSDVNETPEITLNGKGKISGETTVLVGDGVDLSFKDGESDTAQLAIIGSSDVNFVGEGAENSTVDFSDLDKFTAALKSSITFEDITVVLGNNEGGKDSRIAMNAKGLTLTFKNSVVKFKVSPFAMNSGALLGGSKIVIENSTFIAEKEVGLSVWNPQVTIEATNSIFYGPQNGAFIRSGNATFTNCKFYTKADEKGAAWADGDNNDVSAALVVGNKTATAAYRNANVTLTNCEFGLCDAAYVENLGAGVMATSELTACTAQNPAIAVFSSSVNSTTVKLDAKTLANADGAIAETEGAEDTLTWDLPTTPAKEDLGATPEEQTANAAKLVESLVTVGGAVNLPKDLGTVELEGFIVPDGTSSEIDLQGNTVNFGSVQYSNSVEGELSLTGGTLNVEQCATDGASPLAVEGKLTLTNMTVVTDGSILPCNGGELVIKNTFIRSNFSMAVTTTNTLAEPDVHITIEDSTIASMDQSNGVGNGNTGNVGLLINNPNVILKATRSTFYGVCTGAWVRGGTANFTGCTFITGSALIGDGWASGCKSPANAKAALLIGNGGSSENYGKATVTLTGCHGIVSKEVVKAGEGDKYVPDEGNKVTVKAELTEQTVGNMIEAEAVTDGKVAKKIVLAAYKTACTATLTMDEASAKEFFGDENGAVKDPVVGTDLLLGEGATNASFTVKYTTGTGEEVGEHELLPATILAEEDIATKAPEALKDAAANGGKVVLPEDAKKPIEVGNEVFQVGKDKALEVDLNGSQLKLTGDGQLSTILAKEGGDVTINGNGGTLEVEASGNKAPIGATGKDAKLTIKDTILKTNVSLQGESGATVVLEGTTIISSSPMAISTNNTLQPVHYTITKCKIASYAIGNVALLINGDQVTLEATDTEFYGTCTGVWVRAAEKATFTNCTFITGSAVTSNETWGQGTLNPAAAKAALLIGDGAGNYGDVKDVTIGEGCTAVVSYEWYANRSSTSHNDEAITSVETDKITDKDGWFEFAPYDGTAKNKLFVIAEAGTQTANVKFANETVAKAFGITGQESLVKDTNVYLVKDAAAMQIVVTIGEAEPFSPKAE